MNFFPPTGDRAETTTVGGYDIAWLRTNQCLVCPLYQQQGFTPRTPQMKPHGSTAPEVYILGEAPGADEDAQGRPFVGRAGQYLKRQIPKRWDAKLRWNNVVRSRPKGNENPPPEAIECCRPSIEQDIATSKPKAIFGFGAVPLHWALGEAAISRWRGRRVPVNIGGHACWYYPMLHPSYILHLESQDDRRLHEDMEFVFRLDLARAFAQVERKLPPAAVHDPQAIQDDIELLYEPDDIQQALQELADDEVVGIDLETHGTRPYAEDAKILTVALSGTNRTVAFGLDHPDIDDRTGMLTATHLRDFLLNHTSRLVSFSLGFELEWLGFFFGARIIFNHPWGDAQLQAFVLDERRGVLSLDALCLQHFGIHLKAISNVDVTRLIETPLESVLPYNALDAKYHRLLYLELEQRLGLAGLWNFYEHRALAVKAAVLQQLKGVPINSGTVQAFINKYQGVKQEAEDEIANDNLAMKFEANTGHAFRPSSVKDVRDVFRPLGIHLDQADEKHLVTVDHPLAALTLKWRHANKLLSTYVMPCLPGHEKSVVFPDGKLHPILSLFTVRTSRTSSEDPNVQNWSKHGEGKEVRGQIEAPPGYCLVSFDYGQIQARNVAQESKDATLVKYFWDRHDIHGDWAERLMQLYPQWVKEGVKVAARDKAVFKEYRQIAKNLFVFPSFFGASAHSVAKYLNIPPEIGEQMTEEFWQVMPGVKQWHLDIFDFYRKHGYVTGLSGHRRHAPVAHTEMINAPIQADEAVIVLDAMIRLAYTGNPHLVSNLMVHDDLTFIWPKDQVDALAEQAIAIMLDSPFKWAHRVPIVVEMSMGQVWSDMKEVGAFESDKWTGTLSKS